MTDTREFPPLAGYPRPDGRVGFRNHLLVLPQVVCANHVASLIARELPGAQALPHEHGCAQLGTDFRQTVRTLTNMGRNPNAGAVLLVGLGCETMQHENILEDIAATGKPVERIMIHEAGGTTPAVERGRELARSLLEKLAAQKREEVGYESLIFGTKCGSSDATSGLCANPVLGAASDLVVEAGGTVVLPEAPEWIGTEHLLTERAAAPEAAQDILEAVAFWEKQGRRQGYDVRGANPTPGNKAGGITTLEEKSLGCILKAGGAPIEALYDYGEIVDRRGLVLMNTTGYDVETIAGVVAGGAQALAFTTGLGTPVGAPLCPVLKITANTRTFAHQRDDFDLCVGGVLEGAESLAQAGLRVFEELAATLNGKLTRSEALGHTEFAVSRLGVTF